MLSKPEPEDIQHFLNGIASAFQFGVDRPYVLSRNGFREDAANSREDAKRVARTFRQSASVITKDAITTP